jgi:site-specific DNA-adenine methylase
MIKLKPFWRYYGGKYRAAPKYPTPDHGTIIEPFAGAAGYSTRYHDRNVILVEKNPVIAEMWRWLIAASPSDVLAVPNVDHVDDLPSGLPEGAVYWFRFTINEAVAAPRSSRSPSQRRAGTNWPDRVASQVEHIKHWKIIEGDYTQAPMMRDATYFVDPPYNNKAGSHYPCGPKGIDYPALGQWCQEIPGQAIVCENEGADWLPFVKLYDLKTAMTKGEKRAEVVWIKKSLDPDPVPR